MDDRPLSNAFLLIALSFLLITAAVSLFNQYTAPAGSAIAEASAIPGQNTVPMRN